MAARVKPVSAGLNLTEQVHERLTTAIAQGDLETGSLHSMTTLANQLGVSRTPVREAMLQLAQRGLVKMVRNQGVMIIGPSVEDLRQIFEIRLWTEVPAVRAAAARARDDDKRRLWAQYQLMTSHAARGDGAALERADRLLHSTILELSGNARLVRLIDEMRDFAIARGRTTTFRSRTPEEIAVQHLPILEAIDANDPEAAAAAMLHHLQASASALLTQEAGGEAPGAAQPSKNRRSKESAT